MLVNAKSILMYKSGKGEFKSVPGCVVTHDIHYVVFKIVLKVVFEGPVQSGYLLLVALTETETGLFYLEM